LNYFTTDSDAEVDVVRKRCAELGVEFAVSKHHPEGGKGAVDLADAVMAAVARGSEAFTPTYELSDSPEDKIRKVAQKLYGADDIALAPAAKRDIKAIVEMGYGDLPVCIAKVPGSLSDNAALVGRPTGFTVGVRNVVVNAGAGFLVVITGNIFRMPGLPRVPMATKMDLMPDGEIIGLE